jgi:hypothetical protein
VRTLQSLQNQEQKLRALHTAQTTAGKWREAQTTRDKLKMVLDQIHELKSKADAMLPEK